MELLWSACGPRFLAPYHLTILTSIKTLSHKRICLDAILYRRLNSRREICTLVSKGGKIIPNYLSNNVKARDPRVVKTMYNDVKNVELYCSGTRDPGPVRGESVLYSSVKYDCLAARGAPPAEGKLLHQGRHPDRRGGHV